MLRKVLCFSNIIQCSRQIQGIWAQSNLPTPVWAPITMSAASALPFSLTPAHADKKVINYASSKGKNLFISATTRFNIDFDGNPVNLNILLESLCHCTCSSNWLQIMSILVQKGTYHSIIDEYRQLTMLDVCTSVDKYHGKSCHGAQNCYQLYMCLLKSITRGAFHKENDDVDQ